MNSEPQKITPEQQRKSRLALIALIGIVIIPVVASSLIYFTGFGVPTHTVNQGQLVSPPVDMDSVALETEKGTPWHWRDSGPVYKLVQFIDGDCLEPCKNFLYTARQVHTRLGKEADQVIRVLVHNDAINREWQAAFLEEYPGIQLMRGNPSVWQSLLPSQDRRDGSRLYIVDRRSHLVMYYTQDHDGNDLLKDLKHLIKNVQ